MRPYSLIFRCKVSVTDIIESVMASLEPRYGKASKVGRCRLMKFGASLTCSINYSKLLSGQKFFYGLKGEVIDEKFKYPDTQHGDFVLLVCGSADRVLVLPRSLILQMLRDVPTHRIDIYLRDGAYVLKTAKHPGRDVTEFLNAFPEQGPGEPKAEEPPPEAPRADSVHLKMQWALTKLGHAEGCSVWVPANNRNLLYRNESLAEYTLPKLPNFGFDDNTRRIVQNIDVLWLSKNVIRRAFEIESSTSIYSGLLRMNDLVLAQPNNQIELYIVTSRDRRAKLFNQLIRPSFQQLLSQCQFLDFESVEGQITRLESLSADAGIRVSGLVRGERFTVPEHVVYPSDV